MAQYVWTGKYSAQGSAAVAKEGLTSRKQAVEQLLSGLGMKLIGMWGMAEPKWDFLLLCEGDTDMRAQGYPLKRTCPGQRIAERLLRCPHLPRSSPGWLASRPAKWIPPMRANQAAIMLMTMGTGMFERAGIYSLLETEEVDEAQKAMPGYRPPGGTAAERVI